MGGYVLKYRDHHTVIKKPVTDEVLGRLADAMGITKEDRAKFISESVSLHIYRGKPPTGGASR
jgi:hypothetical protein